jgi:hypothetical protein
MSISTVFSNLKESERETLYYAQANHISQFIEYKPGFFIGVYVEQIPRLVVQETRGPYSIGVIDDRPNGSRSSFDSKCH